MGTRPLELLHLFGDLNNIFGIGPKTINNLKNISIEKPRDFLFTLPEFQWAPLLHLVHQPQLQQLSP